MTTRSSDHSNHTTGQGAHLYAGTQTLGRCPLSAMTRSLHDIGDRMHISCTNVVLAPRFGRSVCCHPAPLSAIVACYLSRPPKGGPPVGGRQAVVGYSRFSTDAVFITPTLHRLAVQTRLYGAEQEHDGCSDQCLIFSCDPSCLCRRTRTASCWTGWVAVGWACLLHASSYRD